MTALTKLEYAVLTAIAKGDDPWQLPEARKGTRFIASAVARLRKKGALESTWDYSRVVTREGHRALKAWPLSMARGGDRR